MFASRQLHRANGKIDGVITESHRRWIALRWLKRGRCNSVYGWATGMKCNDESYDRYEQSKGENVFYLASPCVHFSCKISLL